MAAAAAAAAFNNAVKKICRVRSHNRTDRRKGGRYHNKKSLQGLKMLITTESNGRRKRSWGRGRGEEEKGRVNLSVLLIKWPGDGRDGAGRCRRHQPFDAATQGARVYSVIFLSFFFLFLPFCLFFLIKKNYMHHVI